MKTKYIRVLALCIVLMLCLPMAACDTLAGGLVGELLELVSGKGDPEQPPEDFSQVLDSVFENFTMPPKESTDVEIPTPETTGEDTVEEITTGEEIGPEYNFVEGLEYLSHGDGTCSVVGIGTCTDTEIVIPSQTSNGDVVVRIADGAFVFDGCEALTSVMIPDTVISIDYYAFFSCVGLTEITIPDSVISINGSFVGCTGLTSVTLPKSLTSINGEAFSGCVNLTSITVAQGNAKYHSENNCVIETATNTLAVGCQSSVIPDYVTDIGYRAFYGCSELKSITIPDSVTRIHEHAFIACDGLSSFVFPVGVTSIDPWMFFCCSGLKSVTILGRITSIGDYAFNGCDNLTDIYYAGTQEEWAAITIGEENEPLQNVTVHFNYVPEE